MQEDILDIELMDRPIPGEGKGEDNLNSGELDDGTEGLVIVRMGRWVKPGKTQQAL
jgi:hypothetical protein